MTETFTPLLQFRAGSRTFASGASNLPTGETPLAPSLRSGFSIPHSPSAQAGELAGVGKALSKLGFDKVKSNRIYYRNIVLKPAEAQQDA